MNSFKGRKTGLFKPVWLADRFPDGLVEGEGKEDLFLGWFFWEMERRSDAQKGLRPTANVG
jgi:hypothetical protein